MQGMQQSLKGRWARVVFGMLLTCGSVNVPDIIINAEERMHVNVHQIIFHVIPGPQLLLCYSSAAMRTALCFVQGNFASGLHGRLRYIPCRCSTGADPM